MKQPTNIKHDYINLTFCTLQNILDFDLSSLYSGYQSATTAIKNFNVIRSLNVVKYIISGKGYVKLNGKTYPVSAGDVFIIPQNVPTTYCADEKDPFSYYYFGIDGLNAAKTLEACGLGASSPVRRYPDKKIGEYFKELYESLNTYALTDNLKAISTFFTLLAAMSQFDPKNTVAQQRRDINYVNAAINRIKENYAYDMSVTELAADLGISRTYFSAVFKRETGMSPQEYLLRFRITQACQLITLNTSVADAGTHCGFNSPANFCVQFKKIMGVSPRAYQQLVSERLKTNSTE